MYAFMSCTVITFSLLCPKHLFDNPQTQNFVAISITISEMKCVNMGYQKFFHQLMHKRTALNRILKFTLKQLQHVSV